MVLIKIKNSILISILVLLISSLVLPAEFNNSEEVSYEINNISLLSPSSIIIDGILSPNEWDDSENVTKWFMEADPENYDGYNYFYLAEDANNLYVGIDLVSDQTNDEAGEWIGIWLNTNNSVLDNIDQNIGFKDWSDKIDMGFESLIIDVDNNQTMPFFTTGLVTDYFETKSLSYLNTVNGSFSGVLDDIKWTDSNDGTITSENNGTDDLYRLDINFDLNDFYDIFPELFLSNVSSATINVRLSTNETLDSHYLTIRDSSGNLLLNSPDHTKSISSGTTEFSVDISALPGNFTQDDIVQFSLIGTLASPFEVYIDQIYLSPTTSSITWLADGWLEYPYSSIVDYDVAWSFAGSEKNSTAHRMFEFRIPKAELEHYSENTNLGVMIGGYGTLAAFPNTHNWVLANNTDTGIPHYYTPNYLYYNMPMKGWVQPNNPILSPFNPNPSITGDITLNWNADPNVLNWNVLRYNSEISELNINDVEIIANGLTTNQYIDTGLTNGTYWYAVAALDTLDYAYLSNNESVIVEIPAPLITPSSDSDTSGSSSVTTSTPGTLTSDTSTADTTTSSESNEDSSPGFTIAFSMATIFATLVYSRRNK